MYACLLIHALLHNCLENWAKNGGVFGETTSQSSSSSGWWFWPCQDSRTDGRTWWWYVIYICFVQIYGITCMNQLYAKAFSVCETLWNFIGHTFLLRESFHRTDLNLYISPTLSMYRNGNNIGYFGLAWMRPIRLITNFSCHSKVPMNLAVTGLFIFSLFMHLGLKLLPHDCQHSVEYRWYITL